MADYDVIVVGAGNGGLTGALTLCKGGKKVLLLERHNIPGGYGTTFRRGRFEFETALHQLYGISDTFNGKKGSLRKVFEALDVYDKIEFIPQTEAFRLAMGDQVDIAMPGSHDGFVEMLKKISPTDSEKIDEFQGLCDKFGDEFDLVLEAIEQDVTITKEMCPTIFEYGPITGQEIMDSFFQHPLVKGVYQTLYGYIGMPMDIIPFFLLGGLYGRGEGTVHVKGGSQAMSAAIANEFLDCGGELRYNTEVAKILVEDNQVKGVLLDSGETIYADRVLSNASKLNVYVDMIDEACVPEEIFNDLRVSVPSQSMFTVYLGLDCTAQEAGIKNPTSFLLPAPGTDVRPEDAPARYDLNMRKMTTHRMLASCYNLEDPDFSPPGTCVLSLLVSKTSDFWTDLTPDEYHDKKLYYAEKAMEHFYSFYPQARGHVEEFAIATPITHMRYANAPKGSIYGLDANFKDLIANKYEVDSPIKGLYFCGASVITGGFNVTLMSGYTVGKKMLNDYTKEA